MLWIPHFIQGFVILWKQPVALHTGLEEMAFIPYQETKGPSDHNPPSGM